MRQSSLLGWLLVAATALNACSSDKAALEGGTTATPVRPAKPAASRPTDRSSADRVSPPVSAYASVPVEAPAVRPVEPKVPKEPKTVKVPNLAYRKKAKVVVTPVPAPRVADKVAVKAPVRAPVVAKGAVAPVAPVSAVKKTAPAAVAARPARPVYKAPTAPVAKVATPVAPRPRALTASATRPAPLPASTAAKPLVTRAAPTPKVWVSPKPRAVVFSKPKPKPTVKAHSRKVVAVVPRPDTAVAPLRPLARLWRETAVPAQTFTVNPLRDTVLRGTGGTLLRLAAGALARASDTVSTLREPVVIHLREFASAADLVLGNISTRMADGQVMETGGTVWVEAATMTGHPCILRSGRDLHLALPVVGARRPAMRTFAADSLGPLPDGLRWRPATADPTDVVRARPPAYGPGMARLESTLRAQIGFSPALANQLLERMPLPDRRRLRKEWSESGKVLRYTKTLKQGLDVLSIPFEVTENGTAFNWGTATGYHSILVNALQLVAPALPGPWRAGSCAGRAAAMRARIMVLCYEDGVMDIEVRTDPDDWTPCESPARAQFVTDFERRPSNGPAPSDAQAAATAPAAPVATLPTPAEADALGARYLLDTNRFGWISCYRFAESTGAKVNYTLPTGAPDADVRLVFRRMRVVLAGTPKGEEAHFPAVPVREPVTVVAVRTDAKGQHWLALQPAVTGEPLSNPLTYKAVSVEELRSALAGLDGEK